MLRSLDRWLLPWLLRPRRPANVSVRNLVFALCDHFEPLHQTDLKGALRRLSRWRERFPAVASSVRDASGVGVRHTFFYPVEQYREELLAELAGLCRETGGEVEVHLHHQNDTADGLRAALDAGMARLRSHGFLGSDRCGTVRFGFIHGNWALDHSDPLGRHCGVPDEIGVLRSAGCYADFTMPSAPHPTQVRVVNRIYYAPDTPAPRSHDDGIPVAAGKTAALREDSTWLLCVQGPLALNFARRKWGVLPRVENADLTLANPPSLVRLGLWVGQGIHVAGRPDTVFLKLHSHGAPEPNHAMFLDGLYERFLQELIAVCSARGWRLCFASARELVNIVAAFEDGHPGDPDRFRNYLIAPPPIHQS